MTDKLNIQRITSGLLTIIALVLGGGQVAASQTSTTRDVKNVVLIHGGFVDGSGWEGVYSTLKKKGYNVTIEQNPTISLADDVALTKRIIAAQDGPVILVGHSYGGVSGHRSGERPQGRGARLYCSICPRQWRVSRNADQKSSAGGVRASNLAAAGRVPLSRPVQVRGVICRRCESRFGWVHGRFSGSVGRAGTQRNGGRTRVEVQAELVPGFH